MPCLRVGEQPDTQVYQHYGEFANCNIRQFNKLIGVIGAHQLLENDIDQHEYRLATSDLRREHPRAGLPPWISWNRGVKSPER